MPPRKRAPAKKTTAAKVLEKSLAERGPHHDETDVAKALERKTDDGPGELDKLPESNWKGYATEGVEKEDSR
jgi:hypothetical protein